MAEAGVKFSQNYLQRGEPTSDSVRARRRLYRLFDGLKLHDQIDRGIVELETGAKVPFGPYRTNWEKFFLEAELRDLLDTITVVCRRLKGTAVQTWLGIVAEIFREENLGYRVDDMGGVHFAIDGEFAHNQACALAVLSAPRLGAVRSHFEASQVALDATPPATREAIRQLFEAIETAFKLAFPDVARLGSSEAVKKLRPVLEAKPQGTDRDAQLRLFEGFKEWINSAHPFRHAQGTEQMEHPGIETAVLSISLGSSYLRWLVELLHKSE